MTFVNMSKRMQGGLCPTDGFKEFQVATVLTVVSGVEQILFPADD